MSVKATMQDGMTMNLQQLIVHYPNHVASAVYVEGQIEMTEAKRRTPVDTRPNMQYPKQKAPHPGQLRNSGQVHKPEIHGRRISVTLSFGGAAQDYAIHVHENPDAYHPVGQWKYLESVLNESRASMGYRLAKRLNFGRMKKP